MIAKSALMVAGDKEKHLDKLDSLKCDIALVNLEDGVANKQFALNLLQEKFALKTMKSPNKTVVVRINPLNETGKEEIQVLNKIKPDAIRLSKVKTAGDVKAILELVDKDIDIHLSIETKEALNNLTKLKVNDRVTTVYIGILDMLESLGLPQSLVKLDNPMIEYILSKFLVDSKIAGLQPLSSTYQDYKNTEEFTAWCQKEKSMGFTGKSCISPTQVEIANKIFGLNEKEIQKAQYIKRVFEEQKANGYTGFSDEKYGFIDEPIYKDALLVLNKLI